jgi:hypothetical protein
MRILCLEARVCVMSGCIHNNCSLFFVFPENQITRIFNITNLSMNLCYIRARWHQFYVAADITYNVARNTKDYELGSIVRHAKHWFKKLAKDLVDKLGWYTRSKFNKNNEYVVKCLLDAVCVKKHFTFIQLHLQLQSRYLNNYERVNVAFRMITFC